MGQGPWSPSADGEISLLRIPPQGVNSKKVQWTVFEEVTPWEISDAPRAAGDWLAELMQS